MIFFLKDGTFQSTPSAWRETFITSLPPQLLFYFNPLPPHGGRHHLSFYALKVLLHFNPLPPHGGRRPQQRGSGYNDNFNPLPPHGGRRIPIDGLAEATNISIHSLRMEGDI